MKKPLLSEMTLREKIGQCMITAQKTVWQQPEPNVEQQRPLEETKEIIDREQYGGYWAEFTYVYRTRIPGYVAAGSMADQPFKVSDFGVEGTRVKCEPFRAWIKKQSDMAKIPSFHTADFEMGAGNVFSDLNVVAGPTIMAAADDETLAYELGACVGKEMRCAGINWRWAPVVDICGRFSLTMLRSFNQCKTDRMIALANANIKGMQDQGIVATAKHFPGGDRMEYRDAHFSQTVIRTSMEEWLEDQGKIFQGVIDGGVYSVMIGHAAFPAADDTKINGNYIPATVSKKIITGLLKEKMGFKGVVISDDIGMGGIATLYDYETLMVEILNAGTDIILNARPGTGDILLKAVADGRISEERINDACQRVLDLKEKIGLFDDHYYDVPYSAEEVAKHTREVNKKIVEKSITLVRDRNNLLPLNKEKIKKVTIIVSSHDDSFMDELETVKQEFEARGASVYMQRRLKNHRELKLLAEDSDLILYATYVGFHAPMGAPFLFGDECKTYFYALSSGREKSIGLSMGYPYIHYDIMENADTFINTYAKSKESMKAFVKAIYGEIPIEGKSPVELKDSYSR